MFESSLDLETKVDSGGESGVIPVDPDVFVERRQHQDV
jgi:hypothetical protein